MIHKFRGVLERVFERLGVIVGVPVITLVVGIVNQRSDEKLHREGTFEYMTFSDLSAYERGKVEILLSLYPATVGVLMVVVVLGFTDSNILRTVLLVPVFVFLLGGKSVVDNVTIRSETA